MKIILPKQELYDYYVNQKKSSTEISKIFNCGSNTVLRNFRLHNILVRKFTDFERKLYKPIDKELLKKLYIQNGKSSMEISKLLAIPFNRILYQLKKYRFKVRNSGSMGNEVKINKKDLYRLYVIELKTLSEIGKIYDVSSSTVKNYMIKFGFRNYISKSRPKFCIGGNNHPTKRPEVREKMSKNHADVSGNKNPNAGTIWMIGENNPNWRGGLDKRGYSWNFNESLKKSIRNRDNYICQNCGMTEKEHLIKYQEKLHIHHIDYNKHNCYDKNLITLCLKCNILANYNRDKWQYKFGGILNGK